MKTLLLSLSLAATLAGCGVGANRRIEMDGVASLSAADRAVIEKRLGDDGVLGFLNPKPVFATQAGHVEIRVHAAPEADADTRLLLSHRGVFEVRGEDGQLWLTQGDIADAQPQMGQDGRPMLRLKLTDAGAKRLSALSSAAAASLGTTLKVTLDDETLATPGLHEPITGGYFQLPISRTVGELFLVQRLIMSGNLSFRPADVRVSALAAA